MNNKLFVYGILKRGYELDLSNHGARFLGEAHIPGAVLYGIGRVFRERDEDQRRPWRGVGLGLDKDPNGVAHGELWDVTGLWGWLDDIEQNGFCYTRKIVPVRLNTLPAGAPYDSEAYKTVQAYVYEYTYPNFDYANPIEGGKF